MILRDPVDLVFGALIPLICWRSDLLQSALFECAVRVLTSRMLKHSTSDELKEKNRETLIA